MCAILYDLEMRFGDSMRADRLLLRAIECRPYHYFHLLRCRAACERGVKRFAELTDLTPTISPELRARRRHSGPGDG